MTFLLDTNVCVHYLNGSHAGLKEKFMSVPRREKHICSVVAGELYYGAYRSARVSENLARFEAFIVAFPMLVYDLEATRWCGRIRADLALRGTPIGPYDVQIAAIALAHNCTLVTHNTREFFRIQGLRLEDWEAE